MARFPDFFIVGHPKCGTTALYRALRSHPEIFMPDAKEPNFFSAEWQAPDATAQGVENYLSLFASASTNQRIGEASVFYLSSDIAARHIADVQPEARIIAILREPTHFLYSLYLQFVRSDFEPESSFRRALALEAARRSRRNIPAGAGSWHRRLLYCDHARYVEQLRRLHSAFPHDQVLVLIYDDLRRDNEGTLRSVLRFLNVDQALSLQMSDVNPSLRVRSRYLNRLAYRQQGIVWRVGAGLARSAIPRGLRSRIWRARERVIYDAPPKPDELFMVELRHRFKPEVVALSDYIKRDLVALWGYDATH